MGRSRLPAALRALIPADQRSKATRPAHWPPGVDSELEMMLLVRLERAGLPVPVHQFRFCPTRKWHADMAYPSAMLLIEVDGGAYTQGRHTRGKGFEEDCVKLSTAAALGYRVVRVTGTHIRSGEAVRLIAQALGLEDLDR